MTSVYRNIQNVIVKLAGESDGNGNHSLLLNCHYDSVPGSPGKILLLKIKNEQKSLSESKIKCFRS